MSHDLLVQMAYCIKYKFRAGFVLIYDSTISQLANRRDVTS